MDTFINSGRAQPALALPPTFAEGRREEEGGRDGGRGRGCPAARRLGERLCRMGERLPAGLGRLRDPTAAPAPSRSSPTPAPATASAPAPAAAMAQPAAPLGAALLLVLLAADSSQSEYPPGGFLGTRGQPLPSAARLLTAASFLLLPPPPPRPRPQPCCCEPPRLPSSCGRGSGEPTRCLRRPSKGTWRGSAWRSAAARRRPGRSSRTTPRR